MSHAHRLLAALVPPPRNRWVRAHGAELDVIEGRLERLRWSVGLVTIAGWALAAQLIRDPRSFVGGLLARVVAVGLSLVNVAAGLSLVAFSALGTDAWQLPTLGLALAAQGGYALARIGGLFGRGAQLAHRVHLAASALATILGSAVLAFAVTANAASSSGDPEYGPMTVALLVALHGAAALVAFSAGHDGVTSSREA